MEPAMSLDDYVLCGALVLIGIYYVLVIYERRK
jgi:hypothetical protein